MSSEKAALVIAFDEIEKSRRRIDAFATETIQAIHEATSGLPELKQVVVDIQSKRRQIVLAKNKSYLNKDGHLILVYTDGYEEDVGEIKSTIIVRGGGSGSSSSSLTSQNLWRSIVVNTSQNISPNFDVWLVDASAGDVTLTLPESGTSQRRIEVKKINVTGGDVFINPTAPDHAEYNTGIKLCGNCRPSVSLIAVAGGWVYV